VVLGPINHCHQLLFADKTYAASGLKIIHTATVQLTSRKAATGGNGSGKHLMTNWAMQKPSDGYLHCLD
jgi:hypothetical protein